MSPETKATLVLIAIAVPLGFATYLNIAYGYEALEYTFFCMFLLSGVVSLWYVLRHSFQRTNDDEPPEIKYE